MSIGKIKYLLLLLFLSFAARSRNSQSYKFSEFFLDISNDRFWVDTKSKKKHQTATTEVWNKMIIGRHWTKACSHYTSLRVVLTWNSVSIRLHWQTGALFGGYPPMKQWILQKTFCWNTLHIDPIKASRTSNALPRIKYVVV